MNKMYYFIYIGCLGFFYPLHHLYLENPVFHSLKQICFCKHVKKRMFWKSAFCPILTIFPILFNPFLDNKNLTLSKMKAFADNIINVT